ncbi:hypothetical protein BH11PSE11_BH11PSE11_30760 [soil metagenome]
MAKHLLYLTNTQLTAAIWDKGRLFDGRTFDNYPSGWSQFAEYVTGYRDVSAYLLTDLIEEDFQRENLPHVMGGSGQNMIQRRLANLYRDTPYREASHQGREKEGRKDDRMLFSALTNPELLKPWLNALEKEKVAVAGIFSVALLSPLVFKKLALGKDSTLLVSHQSSGLRQSFFQDGYLRFSRLTPLTAWTPEAIADIAGTEMAKTRQFLASTRLVARGAPITTVILAHADTVKTLQPLCPDTADLTYRFVDLADVTKELGLKHLGAITLCDRLFLALLGSRRVLSHYATFEQIRFHTMWQVRIAFNILSILALAAGSIWAAGNGLDALGMANKARHAQSETQQFLTLQQSMLKGFPVTVANPHDMKSAVDLEQTIAQNAANPAAVFALVSKALDAVPQIKVLELNWQTSETDGAPPDPAAPPPPPAPAPLGEVPPQSALIGIPKRPFEILILEGEVVPFKNDYRTALDSVQQLKTELTKNDRLQVQITKPPLDIRPTARLESQAGNDQDLAKPVFTLKLVWKP